MVARRYEQTHPWIAFDLRHELERIPPRFWMLLGEARSKCEHIRYVPLSEDTALRLHEVYFAKGVMATTAIEGNTLSEEEVQRRMKGDLPLPPSKEYLGREIDNMLNAYNGISQRVQAGEHIPLSRTTLCGLNKTILNGLELEPGVTPGEPREHSVGVGRYRGAPAEDIEYLLDRLCDWLESFDLGDPDSRIPTAIIKAVAAHIYIEWIHPFGDGNGRLGRLAEFLILIQSGVPLPAAHVLTSHYNETRTEYYRQLDAASRLGGDLRAFLMYAAQGFVDGLRGAIKRLHGQQEILMWQALVDEAFHDRHGPAAHRQRHLAIELGRQGKEVARRELRLLTPQLAELYAGRTTKTLTRDVNRLAQMGLVIASHGRVRAFIERVRGMRPFVLPGQE